VNWSVNDSVYAFSIDLIEIRRHSQMMPTFSVLVYSPAFKRKIQGGVKNYRRIASFL
jgi:hypothetical protein